MALLLEGWAARPKFTPGPLNGTISLVSLRTNKADTMYVSSGCLAQPFPFGLDVVELHPSSLADPQLRPGARDRGAARCRGPRLAHLRQVRHRVVRAAYSVDLVRGGTDVRATRCFGERAGWCTMPPNHLRSSRGWTDFTHRVLMQRRPVMCVDVQLRDAVAAHLLAGQRASSAVPSRDALGTRAALRQSPLNLVNHLRVGDFVRPHGDRSILPICSALSQLASLPRSCSRPQLALPPLLSSPRSYPPRCPVPVAAPWVSAEASSAIIDASGTAIDEACATWRPLDDHRGRPVFHGGAQGPHAGPLPALRQPGPLPCRPRLLSSLPGFHGAPVPRLSSRPSLSRRPPSSLLRGRTAPSRRSRCTDLTGR